MALTARLKMRSNLKILKNYFNKYCNYNYAISLLVDPSKLPIISVFILIIELFLNIYVIERVNYTEIDWKAYMQECEGFLNGTWDYVELKGDTGPLVYPAGFVYIYSGLYYLTSNGANIRAAQYIFLVLYLLQLCLVLNLYTKSRKVPPYALIITILSSYRVHSIYVLRLFNDSVAVFLFYLSLTLFLQSKWTVASIFYSLAVSVKMNILLYAPALFFTYLSSLGVLETTKQLFICALVQLILGAPFLYENWLNYLKGSFDLQRIFEHKWTVNYRFLPRDIFENRTFHLSLLLLHILLLTLFLYKFRKYFSSYASLKEIENQFAPQIKAKNAEEKLLKKQRKLMNAKKNEALSKQQQQFLQGFEAMLQNQDTKQKVTKKNEYSINFGLSSQLFILPMFVVNFIGIVCARSLHYQFYVWYYHSLPYLLFCTNFQKPLMFLILSLIELSWNTYPSTDISSALLHICHFTILYGVYKKL